MNKLIGILVCALFLCSTMALAEPTRYYVKPHSKELGEYIEKQVDVKNKFSDRFSAELDEAQARQISKYADLEEVGIATIMAKPIEGSPPSAQGKPVSTIGWKIQSPLSGGVYGDYELMDINVTLLGRKQLVSFTEIFADLYNANGETVQSVVCKTRWFPVGFCSIKMRVPLNEVEGNAIVKISVPSKGLVQEVPITIIHKYDRSSICSPSIIPPQLNGITYMNGGNGGNGITVAILDTGIDVGNTEFGNRIVDCKSFVDYKKDCNEDNLHGTHVAGIVAGNGKLIGMAPEANIMALKVLNYNGAGYWDDIATAITYAADNGANIISMSLGGAARDSMVESAVQYATSKGVLVVAAAGNWCPCCSTDSIISYPAAFQEVVAVGALNIDIEPISPYNWSRLGVNDGDYFIEEKEVELAAPGKEVSSLPNGCYYSMSGTSMATPNVAGQSARLWQSNGILTREYLHSIAVDILPVGDDIATGFGMPVDSS